MAGLNKLWPYQFSSMHILERNHKVISNSYEVVDGCKVVVKFMAVKL